MIQEYISKRHSTRAFSNKEIEAENILLLFEAARWSPSSRNEQPWRFIYAASDNPDEYNKILSTLNDSNKIWAQNAPLLILTIAKLDLDYTKQLNKTASYDLGGAIANLTIQAIASGLSIHQIGGFDSLKAREIFHIPDNFEPFTVLALGYKGNLNSLPENLQQREFASRHRKELKEFVFTGKFGETGSFLLNQSAVNQLAIDHSISKNI